MKQLVWRTAIILLSSCWIVSCSRNDQGSEEINSLREEVNSLKEELNKQKGTNVSAQHTNHIANNVTIPEFTEFMRVSRRMLNALDTGVSYQDFTQRLVEVRASAQEALPKINDHSQQILIADFVLALDDANNLWGYKNNLGQDRMRIKSISGLYVPLDFPQELGERWNSHFSDLVTRYGLRKENDIGSPIIETAEMPQMIFDRALLSIFEFASTTFLELEQMKQ